jgi:multiple sugar transport system ATP-binding protein
MPRIKAKVEVVEPMGIETYLFLAVDDKSFVARVPSDVKTAVGREIELGMDVLNAHLFDADTERSISNSTDQ